MSESTNKWNITGSRVYTNGEGKSFNLTNKITAEQLYNILTEYEKAITLTETTSTQLTKIDKQLIQINMTLNILKHEVDKLGEMIQNGSNNR